MLVALTFGLSRFVQPDDVRPDALARHDPDLIVENFAAQKLNEGGDVEYAVNAARMKHFRDDDSSIESLQQIDVADENKVVDR